jgi:hypothetical protein
MDLNEIRCDNVGWIPVDIIGPVPICCKHGNELPGFI